jgi:hypothetical protein
LLRDEEDDDDAVAEALADAEGGFGIVKLSVAKLKLNVESLNMKSFALASRLTPSIVESVVKLRAEINVRSVDVRARLLVAIRVYSSADRAHSVRTGLVDTLRDCPTSTRRD